VWNPVAEAVFLGAAGILGGAATSAGAIASLISYPALLAVGLPALPANVTHAVAVVGTGVSSSAASRPELRGSGPRLLRWAAVTGAGAAAGTALLLLTPGGVFDWVVPFLVAAAAILMVVQPRISAWRDRRPPTGRRSLLPYGLFAVAVYDGYFGAASGIMTLALLMLTVETSLTRANAVKNALLGMADIVAALGFIAFGPVHWVAAIPLGIGFVVGGAIGPVLARRVSADALRVVIASAGFALAVWLLVRAFRSS
jgi:uncharacterized membrane protein YfcA